LVQKGQGCQIIANEAHYISKGQDEGKEDGKDTGRENRTKNFKEMTV